MHSLLETERHSNVVNSGNSILTPLTDIPNFRVRNQYINPGRIKSYIPVGSRSPNGSFDKSPNVGAGCLNEGSFTP